MFGASAAILGLTTCSSGAERFIIRPQLIDFGTSEKGGGGQPTSLGQAKKVLDILQNYYCERLGRAICINVVRATRESWIARLLMPSLTHLAHHLLGFLPSGRAFR